MPGMNRRLNRVLFGNGEGRARVAAYPHHPRPHRHKFRCLLDDPHSRSTGGKLIDIPIRTVILLGPALANCRGEIVLLNVENVVIELPLPKSRTGSPKPTKLALGTHSPSRHGQ